MKLYRTEEGKFYGRRADAGKDAVIVEVPTDANGLATFLTAYRSAIYRECDRADMAGDQFETVVERQDPQTPGPIIRNEAPDIHELWAGLPISTQLHFAALAVEEARDLLPKMKLQSFLDKAQRSDEIARRVLNRKPVDEAEDLFS